MLKPEETLKDWDSFGAGQKWVYQKDQLSIVIDGYTILCAGNGLELSKEYSLEQCLNQARDKCAVEVASWQRLLDQVCKAMEGGEHAET